MQLGTRHQRWCAAEKTPYLPSQRHPRIARTRASAGTSRKAEDSSRAGAAAEPGLGLKAAWTAAEQIGNVVGLSKPTGDAPARSRSGVQQMSRADAIAAIKADYDADYFISGTGEMGAYAEDCYFADPFAGFKGTDRFVKNVRNLGGMLDDVRIDVTDWTEEAGFVKAKWRFSSILRVPWRPVLAAGGSTTHKFDPDTGLVRGAMDPTGCDSMVVEHIEAWDTEPLPVLKRLLKPSSKKPTTRWEAFMLAVSRGDAGASLQAVSDRVLLLTTPLVGLTLAARAAFGDQGQGGAVTVIEVFVFGFFLAAGAAELIKLGGQDRS